MIRRVGICAVATLFVVGLAGSPASAQTKVREDRIGDAAPRVDIVSTKVQNNRTSFAVTIRIAKVEKRRTGAAIIFGGATEATQAVLIEAVPVSRGRYQVRGYTADDSSETLTPLACASGAATVRQGTGGYFRFVVPQSCLGARAGRQATTAITFDKRVTQGSVVQQDLRGLRRGDETSRGDEDAPVDFSSVVTTRLG
ncbi:MAG: hypothetical protein Q7T56_19940 [Nocardioidaceae bacterium]|nr:hypothetical protein [Nocardioidaceae bacterium]